MSAALITILIIAVLAGGYEAVAKVRRNRVLGELRAAPVTQLGSVVELGHPVRLTGTVSADPATLVSGPISGALGAIAVSERWEKSSRGYRVRRIDRIVRTSAFTLDDGTGTVRVLADQQTEIVIDLAPARIATSGPNRMFGAGVLSAHLDANNLQDVLEAVVEVGRTVSVAGTLRRASDGTLELVGTPSSRLIVSAV